MRRAEEIGKAKATVKRELTRAEKLAAARPAHWDQVQARNAAASAAHAGWKTKAQYQAEVNEQRRKAVVTGE